MSLSKVFGRQDARNPRPATRPRQPRLSRVSSSLLLWVVMMQNPANLGWDGILTGWTFLSRLCHVLLVLPYCSSRAVDALRLGSDINSSSYFRLKINSGRRGDAATRWVVAEPSAWITANHLCHAACRPPWRARVGWPRRITRITSIGFPIMSKAARSARATAFL